MTEEIFVKKNESVNIYNDDSSLYQLHKKKHEEEEEEIQHLYEP